MNNFFIYINNKMFDCAWTAFSLTHVDEFVDDLLHAERSCDIQLPRLAVRLHLEASGDLEPRVSALDEDLDAAAREPGISLFFCLYSQSFWKYNTVNLYSLQST